MRELKVCQFTGESLTQVQRKLEEALDLTKQDELFEVVEPFQNVDTWHAGFTFWSKQSKLRAVC